jgi:hypothetical protein
LKRLSGRQDQLDSSVLVVGVEMMANKFKSGDVNRANEE